MSLTDLKSIAEQCAQTRTGLGAFNVVHLETARVLIEAAEHAQRPIVLQISENAVKYHGTLEPIGLATLAIARKASVPVAVHLDHAESVELIHEAVALGFSSVMYDGSKLPYEANRDATAGVVKHCHAHGVSVEAELGEVGGKNGVHDPSARTDPAEAALFVAQTGVDLLAVAVGSSHAMVSRDAAVDTDLVQRIHAAVSVPLVLHGSSGVSDEGMRAAIASGITKVNVSTHLTGIFTGAVREFLEGHPAAVDSRKYFQEGNLRVVGEVERLLSLYAHAA